MIQRDFGTSSIKISQLGFGAMRFPLVDSNDFATIDEKQATRMLLYAVDNGVNYVDTAYNYHRGMSEAFVGKIMHGGYRQKVLIATKLPVWLLRSSTDAEKYLDEQLTRLRTDAVDMYLLHGLDKKSWRAARDLDLLAFLDRMKTKGKIRFPGFSFHDELALFQEITDAFPWALCQIHLNYVDTGHQAGIKGMEYAHRKGLPVIIMEPLRGGKLADKVPEEIKDIIRQTGRVQTPVEFALRFLFDRPEIICVLSGMSSQQQIEENIEFTGVEHRNTITRGETELYDRARVFYRSRIAVDCTTCGYCTPCPVKIPISFILEIFNDAHMYGALNGSRSMYASWIKPEYRADKCTGCGECQERCPQKVNIIEELKRAHALLSQDPET